MLPSDAPTDKFIEALGADNSLVPHGRLDIDLTTFEHHLDDPSLTHDQRRAVLSALWTMVQRLTDLAFQTDPVQLACGQQEIELAQAAVSESNEERTHQRNNEVTNDAPEP